MMKKITYSLYILVITAAAGFLPVTAQIAQGGAFRLDQSVIASGGGAGSDSANTFSLNGSVGQSAAGARSTNNPYSIYNGFFAPDVLAPTAATVSIEGRILTASGNGIRNVTIVLTKADGTTETTRSASFGYYRFENIEAGQMIVISIFAQKYHFNEPVRIVNVTEDLANLDFIALAS